ncbi:P-loop containing nucleoside triphosphate hydrolase protein [Dacryopinax primogenitus]|uniref:p-loop containing nucleoside triphosphate hydrolase protein n=1 Tax=Dacryopinax primogenitus (strain DJM 731) TaxID=1858805 RepID=M5FYG6_DACPD|nr:P-loop containing nucleoside triphosphate hydrolase protein [Dacryopinax primogenitus]EJT98591.1 P-loop containing nucleoside triphosphate hydrolase protein [Dacryopinax primogenitus]
MDSFLSQLQLQVGDSPMDTHVWFDLRLIPLYLCCVSLLLLFLTALAYLRSVKVRVERRLPYPTVYEPQLPGSSTGLADRVKAHVVARGGLGIYGMMGLKFVGCAALFCVTGAVVVREWGKGDEQWTEVGLGVAYAYSTVLSFLSLALGPVGRQHCRRHTTLLFLACFSIFGYRDLLPLLTFSGTPADPPWLLYTNGTLLTLTAVLLPLLTPRLYTPADPLHPTPPNPEQVASPLSVLFWSFLDPIFVAASLYPEKLAHLPPLADYDQASYLSRRAMPRLDPESRRAQGLKERHIIWGVAEIWASGFLAMALCLVLRVCTVLLGPVSINRLLGYVEDPGSAEVRPWVWILLLAGTPLLHSMCYQTYLFLTTRLLVQLESVLMQLLFKHSLRIQLFDEPSVSAPSSEAISGESTPSAEETTVGTQTDNSRSSPALIDKGKQRAQPVQGTKESSHLVGKINTLIGTDLGNVMGARDFLFVLLQAPLQLILSLWFLYAILGWAAVIGVAFMLLCIPVPGIVGRWIHTIQTERMKRTDARVQAISETLNVLRMVKMFGWEGRVKTQIAEKRGEELKYVNQALIVDVLHSNLNFVIPIVAMILTFAVYSLVLGYELTASKLFSSIVVFDNLRYQIFLCFSRIPSIVTGWVSLDRINEFLHKTELLDRYTSDSAAAVAIARGPPEPEVVGFHNATFTWHNIKPHVSTPGRRNFRLHLDDLVFKPNTINLIIGPTGSGKTSIFMALLGEMHFQPSGPDAWFHPPREKGIAYAAQESWVQNETIRDNIIFGEPFDEERYNSVIEQCALDHDLALFDAGDQTEVGEKGLTLSGGQKARVTLARAVYSRAKVLLLDDVLSALDVHTSKWIVDKCFRGPLVQGRTVLLVTHNVALAAPVAGNIISLDINGKVIGQGSIEQVLSHDAHLREDMEESLRELEKARKQEDLDRTEKRVKQADGKLVLAEETAVGHLSWKALYIFLSSFGQGGFWAFVFISVFFVEMAQNLATWWLGVWASAYVRQDAGGFVVNVPYYIGVYTAIVTGYVSLYITVSITFNYGTIRAARKIHDRLVHAMLGSTLRWLDSTPVGRIVSRFTQDMRQMDGPLAEISMRLIELTWTMVTKFAAVIYFSPVFTIPGIGVIVIGGCLGQIFSAAQLAIKRQMSNRRSPLYSHFGAAIAGLTSLRAYGAEHFFEAELLRRIDLYSQSARTFYNLDGWISIRVVLLGSLFSAALASYLVYQKVYVGAGNIGFSLNMSAGMVGMTFSWILNLNQFDVAANSLERIVDYLVIEQEPVSTEKGKPPAYWPSSGSMKVENLCARYSKDGPTVLDKLSFEIRSGERIGIVGRTGSGKSSLALSLLRMIPTTGVVYYDGIPTNEINLEELRANITIIPQDPALMSGSLRSNLDPFSQCDDHVLNDALRAAGLFSLRTENPEDAITLDSIVTSRGGNFSVGQRQIIAMARAIVRGTKVLILDEATAAVDAATDGVIQASIRSELKHVTRLTIAHRLQTIADYDRIMVLDAGKVVEFDTPTRLLEIDGGVFRSLVEESVDKQLWGMARKSAV